MEVLRTIPDSFREILNQMKAAGVDTSGLNAAVIGGMKGDSDDLILNILDELDIQNISVTDSDVLNTPPGGSKDIIMDTETGQHYKLVPKGAAFQKFPRDDERMFRAQMPGKVTMVSDPNGL